MAVIVKDVEYSYSECNPVLHNVSLEVKKGKIFALLGPNGSGKTTLMRLIINDLKPKSGSIKVLGIKPGTNSSDIPGIGVGYMPQDLALFTLLTIEEILTFYGRVCGLERNVIKERINELTEVLELPEKHRMTGQLSGGEQRRVSIAVTVIHKPKLIILDEPTVGVDSMLRHRIWQYLEQCGRLYEQTVIITTHYIEEAKSAANVAFMSNGTIIKQDDPRQLFRQYNCELLEEVYLHLLQGDLNGEGASNEIVSAKPTCNPDNIEENKSDVKFNIRRVEAMLIMNLILVKRRIINVIFFLILPIIVIFSLRIALFQNPSNLPIGVYNADHNPNISLLFLDSIDDSIRLNHFTDNKTAIESVVKGYNYMTLVFKQNYSQAFENRLNYLYNADDIDLDQSEIGLFVDNTNQSIMLFIFRSLLNALSKLLDKISEKFGTDLNGAMNPIQIEQVVYGSLEPNLLNSYAPGIILTLMWALSFAYSSHNFSLEREHANLQRLKSSGVRPLEIYATHVTQNFILIKIKATIYMVVVFIIMDSEQKGSYLDIYLILFLQGMQGSVLGTFIGICFKQQLLVIVTNLAAPIILMTTSGIIWPTESVPFSLRYITDYTPLTKPLEALQHIVVRGWTYNRTSVLLGYSISLVYILIFSMLSIILCN